MQIEIKAANTILEKGERIEIPAPFFNRLIGKKTLIYTLKEPSAATCLEAINMRLVMGVSDEELDQMSIDEALLFQAKYGYAAAKIVALVIKRGDENVKVSLDYLTNCLLRKYPFKFLLAKMRAITLSGLEDFINTIGLLQVIRLTEPNDPSQSEKRKQRS